MSRTQHETVSSATAAHCHCVAREGCCPEHPLNVLYALGWITTRDGLLSRGRLNLARVDGEASLSVRQLSTFWVPSRRSILPGISTNGTYQNSGDKLSLESQIWRNILCDGKITRGLCRKAQEIISHIWEKGDNLSLRSTSRARKRECLSSNTGLCRYYSLA